MNVSVKTLPKSEVKLTIELTAEQMQKFREKAIKEIASQVKIPGFRPGHAPYEVLKQHVNESTIEAYLVDFALPETYSQAVVKENVQAISRPRINVLKTDPLQYEATVAIYPEVKISGYDKISIPKKDSKVEEKDIDEVLVGIQKKHATYQGVDRGAQKGDRVEIDFEGFDDGGATLENTKSSNHPLIIGEGSLVPGFEDELIGLKTGEKKSFTVTFPKDYFHKPFQGKKVEFKVEMKKVESVNLPEWNEEFIQKLTGEKQSLADIRKITRENLEHDHQYQEKVRRENECLEEIIKLTQVEIPESLLEEEIDSMMEEFTNELSQQGITLKNYLEATKKEEKDLRDQRKPEAEKRLKLRFGLQQIFALEKLDVTAEELQKEIKRMLELYPENDRPKVEKDYQSGGYLYRRLENKLKMEKLFEKLLGK